MQRKGSESLNWRQPSSSRPEEKIQPQSGFFGSPKANPYLRILIIPEKETCACTGVDKIIYFARSPDNCPRPPSVISNEIRWNGNLQIPSEIAEQFLKLALASVVSNKLSGTVKDDENLEKIAKHLEVPPQLKLNQHIFKIQRLGYFIEEKKERAKLGNIIIYYQHIGQKTLYLAINIHINRSKPTLEKRVPLVEESVKFLKQAFRHTFSNIDINLVDELLLVNPYAHWPETIYDRKKAAYYIAINPATKTLKNFIFSARGLFEEQQKQAEIFGIKLEETNSFEAEKIKLEKIISDMEKNNILLARDDSQEEKDIVDIINLQKAINRCINTICSLLSVRTQELSKASENEKRTLNNHP